MAIDLNASFASQNAEDNNSKKAMVYTSDTGALYVTQVTENYGELLGFDDYDTTSIASPMPDGLVMRKVTYKDSSGKVSGSFPIGKPTEAVFATGGTITIPRKGKSAGLVVTVIGAQGEKRRILSAADTGQQSGDNT
jgi:hypothetical protein